MIDRSSLLAGRMLTLGIFKDSRSILIF